MERTLLIYKTIAQIENIQQYYLFKNKNVFPEKNLQICTLKINNDKYVINIIC